MKRATVVWLCIGAALMIMGGIVFLGVMTRMQWDFSKLSTTKYETNRYELSEPIRSLSVITDTADIVLLPSETNSCTVVCHEATTAKHAVAVKDGTLTIEEVDTRQWYQYIGISFGASSITVHLPQGDYDALVMQTDTGDVEIADAFTFQSAEITEHTGRVVHYASVKNTLKIHTSTGDIRVENLSAGALDLSVSTGAIHVSNVACEGDVDVRVSTGKATLNDMQCANLRSNGSTGDLTMTAVIATGAMTTERSTGDIQFDGCDAAELTITTDTGDVRGALLSDKIFFAQSDTGHIDVPKTTTGGRCEITTDTGNIHLTVAP